MDVTAIGAAGMISAAQRFGRSAQRTVDGSGDPAEETADQISDKTDFEASAKVVQAGDQMMGTLLDIKV
jgi:flagellar hook protein FlgE